MTVDLDKLTLARGSHLTREDGVCAMEGVAWLAGEPHSDSPFCTCPVIAVFVRAWNDALPSDAERNRLLLPLLPALIGTRAKGSAVPARRAWMVLDWQVRVATPAWLRCAGIDAEASALESLPPVTTGKTARDAMAALAAAQERAAAARAAWDAAWAAVGAAVKAALVPTVAALQASAQELLRRMCAEGK